MYKFLSVPLEPKFHDTIRLTAAKRRISMSELTRRALRVALAQHDELSHKQAADNVNVKEPAKKS